MTPPEVCRLLSEVPSPFCNGRVKQPGNRRLWLLGDCVGNEGPEEGRHRRGFRVLSQDGEVETMSSFGKKVTLVWTY